MLVVIAFHPGDAEQAMHLAIWTKELGGAKGHDLLLIRDTACAPEVAEQIHAEFAASFDNVEVLAFTDHFRKWPNAPNAVFATAARHIMNTRPQPWLFFEPDCVPIKAGWLDAIEREYIAAGKPFLGARVEVADIPLHMSGNGVYPADMFAHAGVALLSSDTAWDVAAAEQIVPQAHFTTLIEHSWKRDAETKQPLNTPFDSWEQVEREVSPEAAVYHASKDGSLITLLRERRNNLPVPVLADSRRDGENPLDDKIETTGGEARESTPSSTNDAKLGSQTEGESRNSRDGQFICDILIKSYPPDYEWLAYCLQSIEKFASGFRRVIVVIPNTDSALPDSIEGRRWNTEIRVVHLQESGDGYLFQQTIKASAHEYTDADYVLHLDSDCFLLEPITPEMFFRDGKPIWYKTPYASIDAPWKAPTEKFLGEPVEFEFMRRMPILAPRALHKAAAAFCLAKHGVRLTDYILSQPNREFSEFNALGALAFARARDDFHWIDTTKEELPRQVLIQRWSHDGLTEEIKAEYEVILKGENDDNRNPTGRVDSTEHTSTRRNNAPDSDRVRKRDAQLNPNIKQTKEGWWVLVNDSHISRWIEERGTLYHDRQTLPLVLPEIPVGGTVIDVGAFVGDTTWPFLEHVGPDGQVIAFEPNMDAWECLKRNCPKAQCFPFALGAPNDPSLELAPEGNAGARHLRKFGFEKDQGYAVDIATLDSIELDHCDFIKIDVEGFELRVLRGAEQTINRFHPKLLIEINPGALERQGETPITLYEWVEKHGYYFDIVQPESSDSDPQFDILCKPLPLRAKTESVSNTTSPALIAPWTSPLQSIEHIRKLAEELKNFCAGSVRTRQVRQELHFAGVIELPYRMKKRKGWRKKRKVV